MTARPRRSRTTAHRPLSSRRFRQPWLLLGLVGLCLGLLTVAAPLVGAPAPQTGDQEPPPPTGAADRAEEQEGPVTLVLQQGARPLLKLAFPEIERSGRLAGETAEAARELEETLRADLAASGVFDIQGPQVLAGLELTGRDETDMERYRSLGNELLLDATISGEPGKILFEGAVYDLASRQLVLGKRYRGDLRVARRIAHTFADEVILYFTGKPGISLTSIAFHSDRTGDKEIFVMDYDGENVRQVTAHRSVSLFPAWAPDGAGLAYVSFLGESPGIYYADISSGRKRPMVTAGRLNTSPAFSPDGNRLVFARSLGGNTEILVSDRDGERARQLTHTRAIDSSPAWSPTGNEIAFTSSRTGRPEIWVMDPEGTNLQRISTAGNYNDGASWSPDGTRLVYASRIRGVFQIVVTDRVTLETRALTSGPGDKESPTFSPDGRHIVFSRSDVVGNEKRTQIWVMDAAGGTARQLTREGNNFSPAWSPYPG